MIILDWYIEIISKVRINVQNTCKFIGMKALSVVFGITYRSANVEILIE